MRDLIEALSYVTVADICELLIVTAYVITVILIASLISGTI